MTIPERIFRLRNQLEDFRLFAKHAIQNLHWSLEDFMNADFYELQAVLGAEEVKERVQDPLALAHSMGL